MSAAIRIFQGKFGRVALLNMDAPLVYHAHHHCHILLKVEGCDAAFAINETLQPLTDDTAVLVNAWEPHAYRHPPESAGRRTVILALYIEPGWLAAIQHPLAYGSGSGYFPQPCVAISGRARKLADQLAAEMCSNDEPIPASFEHRLFELMVSVIDPLHLHRDGSRAILPASRIADRRIRRAIAFMRANLGAEPDVETMAAQAGLSRAHFYTMFRLCTNVTPHVYTNVLRMEQAINDLSGGQMPIALLSEHMGFSAPGHFTRFFRQHLGITPSEYRRVVNLVDATTHGSIEI
ncbi:AraC family transcriptional regulator [Burkholderia sp. L27(2015)]|uniref:helix-turn-helix transcriptional regulator n=1 Tax=Burkholderia sp. L27(2015) TaxID=1641858 RepID=UPI00131CC643|nr:AraC family transcriptional regulator [Burkholderia sp. L27(2015)]